MSGLYSGKLNRDRLYRQVLQNMSDSPQLLCSPVTSLANTLLEASIASTPCKRLSLSSTMSDTPNSDVFARLENSTSSCDDFSPAGESVPLSPSPSPGSPLNKENAVVNSSYFSPQLLHARPSRRNCTPFKELQNTAARNLQFSPLKKSVSPSLRSPPSTRLQSPETPFSCDSASRDSGYCESGQKCAPPTTGVQRSSRRLDLDGWSLSRPRNFASLRTSNSFEAFFSDNVVDTEEPLPNISALLSEPICKEASAKTETVAAQLSPPLELRLPIRRCLSMADSSTPLSSRTRPESSPSDNVAFKRPKSPSDTPDPTETKRRRAAAASVRSSDAPKPMPTASLTHRQQSSPATLEGASVSPPKPRFHRCHSESQVSIIRALNMASHAEEKLTGDFSQSILLPVSSSSRHPDLHSISPHTMADLVRAKIKVDNFEIIDCRYPYEYKGGHINFAVNWNTPQMAIERIKAAKAPSTPTKDGALPQRNILIFHCEFSAERGPKTQRLLRELDRSANSYPSLHFPEIYILEGGYKAFYEHYPSLCSTQKYVQMLDSNHTDELRLCRAKSRSWNNENKLSRATRALLPLAASRNALSPAKEVKEVKTTSGPQKRVLGF